MSLAVKPPAKRHAYLTEEGAFLGPGVPLLERVGEGSGASGGGLLRPRSRDVLKRLLTRGYGAPVDLGPSETAPRARQLLEVAKALNRGDLAQARLHLRRMDLPPLPSDARAEALAEADRMLREEALAKTAGMGLGGGRDHYLTEPRDNHGRWTSGGGGGVTPVADKKPPKAPGETAAEIRQKKQAFVDNHYDDAKRIADERNVPIENILGHSAVESGWDKDSRFAREGHNHFGMQSGLPRQTGSMPALNNPHVKVGRYANSSDSFQDFNEKYGPHIEGISDPERYARALQEKGKFGIITKGPDKGKPNPDFVPGVAATIRGLKPFIEETERRKKPGT